MSPTSYRTALSRDMCALQSYSLIIVAHAGDFVNPLFIFGVVNGEKQDNKKLLICTKSYLNFCILFRVVSHFSFCTFTALYCKIVL